MRHGSYSRCSEYFFLRSASRGGGGSLVNRWVKCGYGVGGGEGEKREERKGIVPAPPFFFCVFRYHAVL